jgi:hypothetical protein
MNTELKDKIMKAIEGGISPVDAVIEFEIAPKVMQKLFEEYHEARGGKMLWGNDVRAIEEALGCDEGSIKSGKDLVVAVELLLKPAAGES